MPPRDHLKGIASAYDVIVIGSGLGGLTLANRLGRAGRSVLVLEHHYQLGGLATFFKRRGKRVFDISLHGFPIGMKKTCRKYWTKEIADDIVQVESIKFDNPQFSLETKFDKQDFTRILTERFKVPADVVASFFAELRAMNYYDQNPMTTAELFEKYFPGRNDVVRLLMEPITYANGSTPDDPAITYGIVFSNFMSEGCYIYRGGTDKLLRLMSEELAKNKVDVRIMASVEKVIVEDGEVRGVVVNGREVRAKAVVSNANLLQTIHELVGDEQFSSEFMREVEAVRLNNSSTQVYLGLADGETIPNVGDLLFTSTHPTCCPKALIAAPTTSRTFSIYYPDIRPGVTPERYAIVSSTNAWWEDWVFEDDAEYQRAKDVLVEETIDVLEKYLPGVRQKIEWKEAATPRTFKRYTRHWGGASFGTKFEGLKVSMDLPTQVRGLFHAGSVGIIMSGWLGTVNYGVIQSHNVDKCLHARAQVGVEGLVAGLTRDELLAAIPHRPPFLWLDEVTELTADTIKARKWVDPAEPFFQGHYPEFPITPGVLVCEAMFQAGAVLLSQRARDEIAAGLLPVMTAIKDTRFRTMVRPGDVLELEVELEDALGKLFHLSGKARVGGKVAASTKFACALAPKPAE